MDTRVGGEGLGFRDTKYWLFVLSLAGGLSAFGGILFLAAESGEMLSFMTCLYGGFAALRLSSYATSPKGSYEGEGGLLDAVVSLSAALVSGLAAWSMPASAAGLAGLLTAGTFSFVLLGRLLSAALSRHRAVEAAKREVSWEEQGGMDAAVTAARTER